MRLRFPDDRRPREQEERSRLLQRMDAWWKACATSASSFDDHFQGRGKFDLEGFMAQHLGAVDERLMWEFGPPVRGGKHRLVITPENERQLRPLLEALLSRAPSIPGWELYPRRLAEPLELAELTVKGRTGGTLQGWRVCIATNDAGGVDLTYWNPSCAGPEDEAANSIAFVATESLLGEETLDKFVDLIEVAASPVDGAEDVELGLAQGRVQAALEKQRARLDDRPLLETAEGRKWSLVKLTPADLPDYEHQFDLLVAKTALLPMWQRAHSNLPFFSERFSRHGETFCFIKIDGSQRLDAAGFADKAEIEAALEKALERERLGTVIGGGTGRRYSYVDLALLDVRRSIPILQKTLRAGKVPRRSWLQFFDSELAEEWVGIWDDSPTPPGFEEAPAEPRH
ncbi:MAG TPA: hypothetical protein VGK67_04160 [Myxococcales bacterium]|jgi:hypothetical protein